MKGTYTCRMHVSRWSVEGMLCMFGSATKWPTCRCHLQRCLSQNFKGHAPIYKPRPAPCFELKWAKLTSLTERFVVQTVHTVRIFNSAGEWLPDAYPYMTTKTWVVVHSQQVLVQLISAAQPQPAASYNNEPLVPVVRHQPYRSVTKTHKSAQFRAFRSAVFCKQSVA